ncbi:MAG: twin-arginine translocase TatA/TatE family subunit [Planctomycetaceae bacterium]|jgi:sec-independent protein translocase protein TatA|nr:twin-arginine translocase TatA/TatE family subunit [Planctomycetaceae bacterium]
MDCYLFLTPTPFQIVVVLVLGVLFFGKNLPEVARQIGLGLMEFRKGLNELSDLSKNVTNGRRNGHNHAKSSTANNASDSGDEETEKYELTGTKFEPPAFSG